MSKFEQQFKRNLRKKLSKDLFNRLKKRATIVYGWVLIGLIIVLGYNVILKALSI